MREDSGIPGLHRRICRVCGQENVLNEDVTEPESAKGTVTTRVGRCVRCANPIRYSFQTGNAASTDKDPPSLRGRFSRLRDILRRTPPFTVRDDTNV
jgi:hypothetical protein